MTKKDRTASTTRRNLFKLGALSAGALAMPLGATASGRGFTHGVASGEPGSNGVLLWTRFVADQAEILRYEVAEVGGFGDIVASGNVEATPDRDWCAKTMVSGLSPDRWYFYRFIADDGSISDVGRTRTLPEGAVENFRFAVVSCANIGFGYFNAYAHITETDETDIVLHTGDYIYEYERGTYPANRNRVRGRRIEPTHEIIALSDYRTRYASYRRDADLQRLHQNFPMILVLDDHETADNSYTDGAVNHDPATEGDWAVRKQAALRARSEWLPISDEPYAVYDIGDLATIFRLETRLTDRSKPFSISDILHKNDAASPGEEGGGAASETAIAAQEREGRAVAALRRFKEEEWRDPSRRMMGDAQQEWLADGFKQSRASGKIWQILLQQVIMAQLYASPKIVTNIIDKLPRFLRNRIDEGVLLGKAGIPFNMDAWDGYPVARERLLDAAQAADANLIVLAGDSHNAWASEISHDGAPAGVEFAGQSVSSPGAENFIRWIEPDDFAAMTIEASPQLKWADTQHRGYMALTVSREEVTCEYRMLEDIRSSTTGLASTQRLSTQLGSNTLSVD